MINVSQFRHVVVGMYTIFPTELSGMCFSYAPIQNVKRLAVMTH
jgi:hypothetical protein